MSRLTPLFLLAALFVFPISGCGPGEPLPPVEPSLGDTWIRPTDGMVMVYVPAGEFEMGSIGGDDDEQPVHAVAVDGFWIDRTEVSNGQYRQCVAAGACNPPAKSGSYTRDSYYGNNDYDEHPVIWVAWHQADAYCQWAKTRLPTEAEWEYAARGPQARGFPWGDTFDGTRLNYCDVNCEKNWADETVDDGYADTAPVGSFPAGASWCGALDMAGNVWEWVSDWYARGYYSQSPARNPLGPDSGTSRVLRGGSWRYTQKYARCVERNATHAGHMFNNVGFRCAGSPVFHSNLSPGSTSATSSPSWAPPTAPRPPPWP